jgi:hypothetical protein
LLSKVSGFGSEVSFPEVIVIGEFFFAGVVEWFEFSRVSVLSTWESGLGFEG